MMAMTTSNSINVKAKHLIPRAARRSQGMERAPELLAKWMNSFIPRWRLRERVKVTEMI